MREAHERAQRRIDEMMRKQAEADALARTAAANAAAAARKARSKQTAQAAGSSRGRGRKSKGTTRRGRKPKKSALGSLADAAASAGHEDAIMALASFSSMPPVHALTSSQVLTAREACDASTVTSDRREDFRDLFRALVMPELQQVMHDHVRQKLKFMVLCGG